MADDVSNFTIEDRGSHYKISNAGGFTVAEVYGHSAFGKEWCEDKARLMAASPGMLKMLLKVAAWLRENAGEIDSGGSESVNPLPLLEEVEATIKQAEGGK